MRMRQLFIDAYEAHIQNREDWNGLEALAKFFGQKK
jgi:hypothetical protein